MEAFAASCAMSPRRSLAIVTGLALASWVVPAAIVYGFIQLL